MNNRNRIIFFLIAWLMPLAMVAQTNHWTPQTSGFENNMPLTCVIQINGVEQQSTALEVGAFCGTECRGSALPMLFPGTGRYVVFLTIFGVSGDQFTFKLYDHNQGTELNLQSPNAVTFNPDGLGWVGDPYVLNFTAVNYTISASANPTAGGSVTGAGNYQSGSTCTLTAIANAGYTFVNWTKNGTVVSTAASYSFTVTENSTFVANFTDASGTGVLNGVFSVGENTQVNFSQGNLQYQASTDTWRFATNQWDYMGADNSNISQIYSGWIDLFGWGTSGYHDANDPYNVNYQPWSTSTSQVNSNYNYYGYGPSTNMTDPNLTGTSANYDWGVYNPISNGGNTVNQWRTLTQPEWNYVFNTRTTTSGIRYARANVNNVNGVILLPDDWSSSTYSLSNTNSGGASFSSNTLTASQWSTLEQAGAVFLPAAGYRNGTSVSNVGSWGHYWSASCSGSILASYVNFGDSGLNTSHYYTRCNGRSVRLVRVAENYSYEINATPNPVEGGAVSGGGTYEEGATCTLTATDNTGYTFTNWTKNGTVVSTNASYSFTVTESGTYVANFSQNSYTISASANPSAGGSVTGAGNYNYGATCNLTATANTGYTFTNWTKNGTVVSTNASYSFTVTGNGTYVANFSQNTYTISASANPNAGGSVTGAGNYNYGATCNLTATANPGYTFTNWTKNGTVVSTSANYSFTVTGNGTYVANFSQNSYTISASASPSAGGTVNGGGTYSYGSTCTLTATPATGYNFVRWTKNGTQVSTSANYSFTVTESASYVAVFSLKSYTISASANPTAGGSVSGAGTYTHGSTCTLTATANPGYTFTNWTKNGTVVSTAATYSFTVTENSTFVANFTDASGAGVLNGVFSVGENSHINFSQGNLQYQASTNTWRFATNQWDYVGADNSNISQTYSGWIDLFGWGTSGYNHDANCYQPWSTSQSSSDYYAYGNYTYNLYDQTGQADWGYNAISNGGNQENGGWRTLTQSEWDYVFNTRTTTSGMRYAKANVNNVNGVILLPDDWNSNTYSLNNTNESSGTSFSDNTITASQWATLENAGAVFLPAAGYRYGTSVDNVGSSGNYWSASYGNSSIACDVYFYDSYLDPQGYSYRCCGFSVRLVRVAENYSYEINATSNPAEGGTVSGGGAYAEGTTCTLTATANAGYTFTNWTENGEVVSSEATYSFTVTGNRDLVANFIQVSPSIPTLGMIAYYPFNGNANDESGNENHGTLQGNVPQLTTDRFGNENSAYLFGGYNNKGWIKVPNSSSLDLDDAMSVSFWVNFTDYGGQNGYGSYTTDNNVHAVLCKGGDNSSHPGFNACMGPTGDSLHVWSFNRYPDFYNVGAYYHGYEPGQWLHCVITVGNTLARVYINGVLCQENTYENTNFSNANAQDMTIGVMNAGSWYPFNGKIDDIILYNRAITPQEVLSLYTYDNLVAYYPFNGDANDYSGNGYHATPCNNYQYEGGAVGECIAVEGQGYTTSSGGHVLLPQYDFGAASGITLSLWVKAIGLTSSDGETYINFGDHTNADGVYILQNPNTIQFTYHGSSVSVPYQESYTGNWVMYTLTCGSDGKLRAYVNGAFVGQENVDYNGQINTSLAALGRHWWYNNGATSTRFNGSFDEVRIYSRALSAEEVNMLYNSDKGCLAGQFSVSETTQVNFSQGNLQYQASTNTWRFAEHQWDYVGAGNANISETYDGWIDLFGWGTSGYNHGANAYQPYSTSQSNSDYWAYGNSGSSLSDQTGQADWGYNAIPNGVGQEGQWHTLSQSEWDYLINNRSGTTLNGVENARHAKAVVNEVAGLILFPDNYSHPSNVSLPVNINAYASEFADNEYDLEQWKQMEKAGAVFLPTAGIRSDGVGGIGTLGIYWSSTPSSSSFAHRFDFTHDYVVAWGLDSRWYGYSVRLVKTIQIATCFIEAVPNPIEGGTVNGGGSYNYGSTCTLAAVPNESYIFTNWTENGEVVSTEATYSFTVTGDRNLVANFVEGSVIMIGDGGEATIQYLPSYSFFNYSLTQQIYTADEIGTDGFITNIAFYNGGTEKTRSYDVYMVHTDKNTFDSNTDWITVTEADRVFSGTVTMVANDWTTFYFDTPYAYNGVSNLALIVDDNTGSYSSGMRCRVFNADGNQAIRVYSDGTNYDPYNPSGYGGTLHSVKNQIKLSIIPYELTVHEGTTTNSYVPVYGLYTDAYLKSEFIMPASELTQMAGFSINRMKFYASQTNVSWGDARFQVFMKEVDDTSINSYSGLEGATVVYEGSLNISDGEMDVVFAVPYQYGGGNLLIGFYEPTTGSWISSYWYGETVDGASVQGKSFNSLEDVDCNQRNFLPKTTFYYQVADSYQQSIALAAGWNWFSTNLDITMDDLKAALREALPNANSITIKSQFYGQTIWNGRFWNGQLWSLDVTRMFKINVPADCEITLTGLPINPAEHPVAIDEGANWIGYPFSENMTITQAFTGFAVNGDKIKSNTYGQTTYNGTIWVGALHYLHPGKGYVYKSIVTGNRTFTFPIGTK